MVLFLVNLLAVVRISEMSPIVLVKTSSRDVKGNILIDVNSHLNLIKWYKIMIELHALLRNA